MDDVVGRVMAVLEHGMASSIRRDVARAAIAEIFDYLGDRARCHDFSRDGVTISSPDIFEAMLAIMRKEALGE